jgi:hypothetical protein
MRYACLLTVVALVAAAFPTDAGAEEWPAWRGPRGDGTSTETGVPLRWSGKEHVAWKTPIPGKGHASPVVWGDRVFVITCIETQRQRMLFCLDRETGTIRWHRTVLTAPLERINKLNSYASSTPATDGRHVWVTFLDRPHIRVVAYTMEGEEVWRVTPGEHHSCHGYCSSLIPYKDMIILNADQDAKLPLRAYIVALDGATGEERWRIDRPNRIRSYTPPAIFDAAGRTQMVVSGCECVTSYDPDTGKPYWIIDGPTEQFCASLVYTDGMFMMTGGWPEHHILGIRPDGTGNVTDTHVAWHLTEAKITSYVPSPIAAGKYFFVVSDGGVATCLEAKTGRKMWSERLGKHHSASPVSAEGRLYFLDDAGVMHVLRAAPEFEVLAENDLGEACRASPAVSRGQMFLRTRHHVYCIGASAEDG